MLEMSVVAPPFQLRKILKNTKMKTPSNSIALLEIFQFISFYIFTEIESFEFLLKIINVDKK